MCWYEFLKCYAKIYGFSCLDVWWCFRLCFHVAFDHKHLKLEPLTFESEKNDIFMGCCMKPANRGHFLGMIAQRPLWSLERGFMCSSRTQKIHAVAQRPLATPSDQLSPGLALSDDHSAFFHFFVAGSSLVVAQRPWPVFKEFPWVVGWEWDYNMSWLWPFDYRMTW